MKAKIKGIIGNFRKNFVYKEIEWFFSDKSKKMSIMFAICLFAGFLVQRIENFHPGKIINSFQDAVASSGFGAGFPVKVDGDKVNCKNFRPFGRDLVMITDTSLICFNPSAKKIFDRPHGLSRPILKCTRSRALVYDLNRNNFKIETKGKNIVNSNLTENIISGGICESGNYAFAVESKDYPSKLMVFFEDSKQAFSYSFSDCFLNNVSLSDDGKMVAVSGVLAQDGGLKSLIYVFEINSSKPKLKAEFYDVLFLDVVFLSNSNVIAIGDSLTCVIKVSSNEQKTYNYDQKPLTAFDVNPSVGAVLSLATKADFTDCDLVTIDGRGQSKIMAQSGLNVSALSYNKDGAIASLGEGKFDVYSRHAKKIYSSCVSADVKAIGLFSSRSVYLLGVGEVNILDFA
ncbi:MAG: DUF5711 family protein [Oscillospiraceae bacterium]|nr:DUF5711 family protein [Oscillospiraceae bacterium]